MVDELLARALEARRALGLPSEATDAYRLVHGEGDRLEGLTVDAYGSYLVASLYTESFGAREQEWIAALGRLGARGVYLKQRPRQANQLAPDERRERAPEHAVLGEDAPSGLVIRESGVPFEVRLGDGLSTGLFLDQRDNRARVRDMAGGLRVLNLFAYTCAFGVMAAVGGARETINVDVSKGALERGRRNYALAGITQGSHAFLARDVLEALPRLMRRGERFDLVVVDPPSYATTKSGRFQVERDYTKLAALSIALLSQGGTLLACTNHQKVPPHDLARLLERAARDARRSVRALELAPPPCDHPPAPGRTPHLKTAWIRLS